MDILVEAISQNIIVASQTIQENETTYYVPEYDIRYCKSGILLYTNIDTIPEDYYNYTYDGYVFTVIPKYTYTKVDFIDLFTTAEWREITTLRTTDDTINKLYTQLTVATELDLRDVRVQTGMQYLVSIAVISQEKYNEIFSII